MRTTETTTPTSVPAQRIIPRGASGSRVLLTPRERLIVSGVARGLSNIAIGKLLGVTGDVIKAHLKKIWKATGTRDRASLVSWGFRNNVLQEMRWDDHEVRGTLTDREREVVSCLIRGLNNVEMAEILYLSPHTVKSHISRICLKVGAFNRSHLIAVAWHNKLVPDEAWEWEAE